MTFWLFCSIILIILAICADLSNNSHTFTLQLGVQYKTNTMAAYDQFMLLGDSLFQHSSDQTRGFGLHSALQSGTSRQAAHSHLLKLIEYIRRLDVVNRGFSGYNSEQILNILPSIIPAPSTTKIRFLAVFLGANDATLRGALGSQHVPLDRYKSNLRKIITHPSVVAHSPHIILVTPPPINEYACEENDRNKGITAPRRLAKTTAEYAQHVRDLAGELKAEGVDVVLLDLWTVFMETAGWNEDVRRVLPGLPVSLPGSKEILENAMLKLLLHDGRLLPMKRLSEQELLLILATGLHFNNVAYTIYFTEIMKTIQQTWPDQMPNDKNIPYV